jgi:hypothetical protein
MTVSLVGAAASSCLGLQTLDGPPRAGGTDV